MRFNPIILVSFLAILLITSCQKQEEARRPISQASGTFMKKSVARNKKLVASEEDQIKAIMKRNPKITYMTSSKGYWYSYETKNELDTLTPKKGDIALFNYEITDLNGAIIYSELELRSQTYRVDKQDIMMGLRDGIKLMRKGEKVKFYFPSHMAYGYHGDNKKIGTNTPIICTVILNEFMPEANYKKQLEAKMMEPSTKDSTPLQQVPSKKTISQIPTKSKDTLK